MAYYDITVTLAGVRVDFKTDCEADVRLITDLFSYHMVSGQKSDVVHNVEFVTRTSNLSVPPGSKFIWQGKYHGTDKEHLIKWYQADGSDYIVLGNDELVKHEPEHHRTICYIKGRKGLLGKVIRPGISFLLILLAHTIYAMYGRYTIHSSCVAIDGKAFLFIGRSGIGKSTLCKKLVLQGCDYVGDDLTFLHMREDKPAVSAWLCQAKLFADHIVNTKGKKKEFVDLIETLHANYCYEASLGGIFYVQRADTELSYVERVDPVDVFTWLMNAGNNSRMQYHQQQWIDLCQTTALQCPAFTLYFGDKNKLTRSVLESVIR